MLLIKYRPGKNPNKTNQLIIKLKNPNQQKSRKRGKIKKTKPEKERSG